MLVDMNALAKPGRNARATRKNPEPRRARVLIVVDGGFAHAISDGQVDVAIVDLDSRRWMQPEELAPLTPQFAPLLEQAGVEWPVNVDGRANAAVSLERALRVSAK